MLQRCLGVSITWQSIKTVVFFFSETTQKLGTQHANSSTLKYTLVGIHQNSPLFLMILSSDLKKWQAQPIHFRPLPIFTGNSGINNDQNHHTRRTFCMGYQRNSACMHQLTLMNYVYQSNKIKPLSSMKVWGRIEW